MSRRNPGYPSINIVPTICAECGRVRNQWVNHSRCAKARQQRFAAENAQREARLMPRERQEVDA